MKKIHSLAYFIILNCFYFGIDFVNCQQSCSLPDAPEYGYYKPEKSKYLLGDRVIYSCKEGFTLLGKESRTCKSNEAWSDQTPFCDHPAKLKNPYISRNSQSTIFYVIDGKPDTCFRWEKMTGNHIQLYLDDEVIVHTVRILLQRGTTKIQILTGLDNDMKVCADYERFIETSQWVLIKCKTKNVLANSVKILGTADRDANITICEIEVYVQQENSCDHPPDIKIPHGYFQVSRTIATLICEKGYKSENDRLACESNTWKGFGLRCQEDAKLKTSTRTIILGAVGAVVTLIILILLGITVYLVKKQRNREVVVVFKPSGDGSVTPGSEAEYATAYYETIQPNAPLPPTTPRPSLPPVLTDGYLVPQDSKGTFKKKPMPADIAFGTLKSSTLYGS